MGTGRQTTPHRLHGVTPTNHTTPGHIPALQHPFEPLRANRIRGAGWVFCFGRCVPNPLRGAGLPRPPVGGWGEYSRALWTRGRSRLRHTLIGIRLGPAPVWEGGGRRPHVGSGTTRRVLGAGQTVSEDGGSFVESGGEEGRVCPIRATMGGAWAAVWTATGGFCGARARRREREAGTDGSSSGAHAGYTRGTWAVCEGGRRFACA